VIVKYPTVAVDDATIPYSTSSSASLLGSLVGGWTPAALTGLGQ
jgi:hypothetical protein